MKFFVLFFLTTSVFADTCHRFRLRGDITEKDKKLQITIRKGSLSEKSFIFQKKDELQAVSYLNKTVTGDFILIQKEPVTGSTIQIVENLNPVIPDPLGPGDDLVPNGTVPCPKKK